VQQEPTEISPSSYETIVPETGTTARPRSEEEKARSRFLSRFHKHTKDEKRAETIDTEETKVSKHANKKFTIQGQMRAMFGSWINILLLAAPVGIALGASHQNFIAVFVVNFIAIVPLAALLSYATEEIALRVGETLGGLLNATFGNAVEVIVSVIALTKDEIIIVKTSLIGSILSNLLLVLGMCFFFGGLRREEQFFNTTVAQTAASLLVLAVSAVIIPTVFDIWVPDTGADKVAAISRGVAIILLVVYGAYLFFQLKTHSEMYNRESQKVPMRPRKKHLKAGNIQRGIAAAGGVGAAQGRTAGDSVRESGDQDGLMNPAAYDESPQEDEPEEPQLHIYTAVILLAASTAVVAACAEFLVGSINAITNTGAISTEFVGLILLPIVGNAAEHATAVTVAIKDKMDLAIGVAVGSSMQIALLVIPFTVFLGWCMGKDDMNLSFDGFQVAVLFVSVLLVNYLIS
jgi:Ca2+:H+ antiporter